MSPASQRLDARARVIVTELKEEGADATEIVAAFVAALAQVLGGMPREDRAGVIGALAELARAYAGEPRPS